MTEQEELEAKLSEAFHLMYDGLPEPVQLCHKTYRVVAVNPTVATFSDGAYYEFPASPRFVAVSSQQLPQKSVNALANLFKPSA